MDQKLDYFSILTINNDLWFRALLLLQASDPRLSGENIVFFSRCFTIIKQILKHYRGYPWWTAQLEHRHVND